MIKTLTRTFIILIAAGLISLGWYAYSTTTSSQSLAPDRPAELTQTAESTASQLSTDEASQAPPARPEGDEHGEQGFSTSRLLGGMAATVGQTALVILVVVWLRKLINKFIPIYFKRAKGVSSVSPHLS